MKKTFVVLISFLLVSCMTNQIVRWPSKSDEQKSRYLEKKSNKSIFKDFLWTTPPVTSRKIENNFKFNDEDFTFNIINKQLLLIRNGNELKFDLIKSENNIYPNTEYLQSTTKTVQKWVPKTTTLPETVPVQKTRTVPVTTFGPNGAASTSFNTEYYTDFETRFVTKTDWVWEFETIKSYTIPDFDFYNIELDNEINFYIYNINNEYFLQNPSYLLCKETNKSFWGEKEVNLIFIDSNANGIFLEMDDQILFNTWNPYDPNDTYSEISYLMDNQWYYGEVLKNDLYLDFSIKNNLIYISYLNEKYIGNENLGSLTVTGIDMLKADIFLNGKKYNIKNDKAFKTEYGFFNMRIFLKNHVDYYDSFVVDDVNPDKVIKYKFTEPATLLKITNIFSKNYFVTINNKLGMKTYYNLKEINIPYGENEIDINVNGFSLKKNITASRPDTIEIDFEKEIKNI